MNKMSFFSIKTEMKSQRIYASECGALYSNDSIE